MPNLFTSKVMFLEVKRSTGEMFDNSYFDNSKSEKSELLRLVRKKLILFFCCF
jgi:hypothetical protein